VPGAPSPFSLFLGPSVADEVRHREVTRFAALDPSPPSPPPFPPFFFSSSFSYGTDQTGNRARRPFSPSSFLLPPPMRIVKRKLLEETRLPSPSFFFKHISEVFLRLGLFFSFPLPPLSFAELVERGEVEVDEQMPSLLLSSLFFLSLSYFRRGVVYEEKERKKPPFACQFFPLSFFFLSFFPPSLPHFGERIRLMMRNIEPCEAVNSLPPFLPFLPSPFLGGGGGGGLGRKSAIRSPFPPLFFFPSAEFQRRNKVGVRSVRFVLAT